MLCSCSPLLSSCVLRKEDDGSFYVQKATNPGTSSGTAIPRYILDISYKQEEVNISEIPNIQFSMGLGHHRVNKPEEHYAWMIITAEGCSINGKEDIFRQDYKDFYLNDVYTYIEGERTLFGLGWTPRYPQYYETIEISFPQQDCSGIVSIKLFSTRENKGDERPAVTLSFQYTVKNGVLTLVGIPG